MLVDFCDDHVIHLYCFTCFMPKNCTNKSKHNLLCNEQQLKSRVVGILIYVFTKQSACKSGLHLKK